MRQKTTPFMLRQRTKPQPQTEPPRPWWSAWLGRAKALGAKSRSALLVGAGVLIALAAFFVYDTYRPADALLTERDVKEMVANAMESATPPPSTASVVYDIIAPSLVQIEVRRRTNGQTETDSGSGVIIDEGGQILTSLHVVTDALGIEVKFFDNSEAPALLSAQDAENDIAMLRPLGLPSEVVPATLGNPNTLDVGDEAIVIGNPFGIRHTLTDGVISGLNRSFRSPETGQRMSDLIQFDAAVNPGNSGGALLNQFGQVVGIVTSLFNPTDDEVFIGIGFAVPIDSAAAAAGTPPY